MTDFVAAAAMGKCMCGRALVAKGGFSARYGLDRTNGVLSHEQHKLAAQSYVGRVLVLDQAKGGVAAARMPREMQARGVVPLLLDTVNPIAVQAAALADCTLLSGFASDITQSVPDGVLVEVDSQGGPPCVRMSTPTGSGP